MSFDFTSRDLEQLKKMVKQAAIEELLPDFGKREFTYKEDHSIITKADLAMQERLESELAEVWPQIAMLGEEMSEAEQQTVIDSAEAYWCIDPLDGTNNYAAGIPLFAVSIALIVNGESVQGLIYDPTRDEMFTARKGEGAFLNDKKLDAVTSTRHAQRIVAEIEMKRLPEELALRLITERPYGSQRNSGSSVIDWCWMSAGRFDVYLHGGQKLWDYAAGHLIFAEVGGHSVSLDGEPVFRGRLETRSAFAAQDSDLFDDWVKWIGIPVQAN
ncbi:inositol monophosphatase family protein [Pseudomonadota bacterium]